MQGPRCVWLMEVLSPNIEIKNVVGALLALHSTALPKSFDEAPRRV